MNDLIVITGQTATGKTDLALDYARRLNGEIVNADSRQIYTFLDIVTGKDKETLYKGGIQTHLIDIATPDQPFSSYDFVASATKCIEDIKKRGRTSIIVGGTYLYIKHLLYGQSVQVPPNPKLRDRLEKLSVEELQKELLSINKKLYVSLNKSDIHNPRRLIRKIEILKSGINEVREDSKHKIDQSSLTMIGLKHRNKEDLKDAITKRVEKRIMQGALDEARSLLLKGYKKTDSGLQTIGYTQLIAHLEGTLTLEDAKNQWITKEVQYAKRQFTFMKKDPLIVWRTI